MNWFFRQLRNKLNNIHIEKNYNSKDLAISSGHHTPRHIETHGMNFSVFRANGGYIVQYSQYDRKTDRAEPKLHIITDDKDLGEELSKIISFEALRA